MGNFYTAQEVADILKIKKTTVYDLVKKQTLPATKVGKQIRISKEDFDAYLAHYTANTITKNTENSTDKNIAASKQSESRHAFAAPAKEPLLENASVWDASDNVYRSRDFLRNNTGLILAGDDEVITAFYSYYRFHEDALPVSKQWGNLYDSLYSLYYGKIHAALIPVIEEMESQLYRFMLPGMNIVSIPLAHTEYGLYSRSNLKEQIHSLQDLTDSEYRFAISEKGSFNRIFFDNLIKDAGIEKNRFSYTDKECISSIQAAMMLQKGNADATIGSSEIMEQFPDLYFIPMQKVCIKMIYDQTYANIPGFSAMEEVLRSAPFRRRMQLLACYDTSDPGPVRTF